MTDTASISELFVSLQGEGLLAGVPSVFVRLAGCHLRCRWCDTPQALRTEDGEPVPFETLLRRILDYDVSHVVLTGGEPLLWEPLPSLCEQLQQAGRHVTVETAAPRYVPLSCQLVSLSPKLSNSTPSGSWQQEHEAGRVNLQAIQEYVAHHPTQLKYVIGCWADVEEVLAMLGQLTGVSREQVMLMPMARNRAQYQALGEQVARWCLTTGFRFGPRLQVTLWDGQPGR